MLLSKQERKDSVTPVQSFAQMSLKINLKLHNQHHQVPLTQGSFQLSHCTESSSKKIKIQKNKIKSLILLHGNTEL